MGGDGEADQRGGMAERGRDHHRSLGETVDEATLDRQADAGSERERALDQPRVGERAGRRADEKDHGQPGSAERQPADCRGEEGPPRPGD